MLPTHDRSRALRGGSRLRVLERLLERLGGGPGAAAAAAFLGVALLAAPAQAQPRLEDYDYENLRLRGAGVEVFVVAPNDLDATLGVGGRIDLGFLGPNVRLLPRFAYWSSELTNSEIGLLEERIRSLVQSQNPEAGTLGLELGTVDRSALIFGTDVHWLPLVEQTVRPYLGLGAEMYILNGSGDDIADTFVEDALDLITAGGSAVLGVEIDIGESLTAYGDLRGTLVADVGGVAFTIGAGYLVP